jgi:hypothetical protein
MRNSGIPSEGNLGVDVFGRYGMIPLSRLAWSAFDGSFLKPLSTKLPAVIEVWTARRFGRLLSY